MFKKKRSVSDSEISEQLEKMDILAREIIGDKSKFDKFMTRAADFMRKARYIPALGEVAEECADIVELMRDWGEKRYTALPIRSITLSVAAILYLMLPIDLIPDSLPLIGYIDDIAVVMSVLKMGVEIDLDKYREWREKQDAVIRRARLDMEIERFKAVIGERTLIACLIAADRRIVLLISENGKEASPCKTEYLALPDWAKDMEEAETAEFYDDVIADHSILRSERGRIKVSSVKDSEFADAVYRDAKKNEPPEECFMGEDGEVSAETVDENAEVFDTDTDET